MNVEAITTQISAVADHALSPAYYTLGELRDISAALCLASARIEGEIARRAGAPIGLLSGLPSGDGGAV